MTKETNNSIYREYYNDHPEYIEIRSQTGQVYAKYANDVLYWKLKYIEKLARNKIVKEQIRHIAEIGCATGFLLDNFCKNLNCSKIGIDISSENIKCAAQTYPSISFFEGTFNDYINENKITERAFDLIILSDILEHVENDVELLKQAGKYSKYVILNLPLEKVLEYKERIYGMHDKEGHLRAYDIDDAFALCKNAKMEVLAYFNKRYVDEPVFRKYLLDNLLNSDENKIDALVKYQEKMIHIDLNPNYYKSNFFALLKYKE